MVREAKPLRVSVPTAAQMLDLELDSVRRLIKAGVFTALAPNGRGKGRRLYLLPAEVEAFATGGPDAVRSLRDSKN